MSTRKPKMQSRSFGRMDNWSRSSRAESVAVPLAVNRRVYNLRRFDREFGFIEPDTSWHVKDKIQQVVSCSGERVWKTLVGFMPILHWLPKYNLKRDFVSDLVAGVTIAIIQIPQGMAYASLASLAPVYGLYTSFFPALFYMFFGTSRHVSLGVFAVVSLMVGQVRLSILPDEKYRLLQAREQEESLLRSELADLNGIMNVTDIPDIMSTSTEAPYDDLYRNITPVSVVAALCFTVGMLQIIMGMLRLDFITAYLSDQVVSGFTTGAACHVFTAQLNKVLNVKLPRHKGVGALVRIYSDLLKAVPKANYSTIMMSFVTMLILVIGKEFINPHVKKKFNIPVPWELVVVIGGTAASYIWKYEDDFHMKVVGFIPPGLPVPTAPPLQLMPVLVTDAIGIAVVAFVVTASLGKLFAKKHHYHVDARQELYALGFMSVGCSFFSCWPPSTALARSLVYEQAGAKTQGAAIFTSVLLAIVLLWLGPLFNSLPMCVLASIILVALKGMFLQFSQLANILPVSKIDFLIWVVSFLATVILDVREGLIVSVLFAVLTSVVRSQRPPSTILGRLQETDIYHDVDRYRKIELVPYVCVFRFDSPLMFTNAERFRALLYEQCHVDLESARAALAAEKAAEIAAMEEKMRRQEEGIAEEPDGVTVTSADGGVKKRSNTEETKVTDMTIASSSGYMSSDDAPTSSSQSTRDTSSPSSNGSPTPSTPSRFIRAMNLKVVKTTPADSAPPVRTMYQDDQLPSVLSTTADDGKPPLGRIGYLRAKFSYAIRRYYRRIRGLPEPEPDPMIRPPGMRRRGTLLLAAINAQTQVQLKPKKPKRYIVLDCSGFNYVDYMGINCLMEVYMDLAEVGVGLLYASFKTTVRDVLGVANFYQKVPKSSLYPTVHDAVVFAQSALIEEET